MRSILRAATGAGLTLGLVALGASAAAAETYEVQPGDTLYDVAAANDEVDDWQQLAEINDLSNPDLITVGQTLALTGDASTSSDAPADDPAAAATTVDVATWDRLAQCESSGDWSINTGNGYYGGLQFKLSSWEWVGGEGMPHEASKAEQIHRAELLLERQGWNAWPACSSQLGLR